MADSSVTDSPVTDSSVADLLARMGQGDRLALTRLLSLAARGESSALLAAGLPAPTRPARVIAFTGSGGVGKSSLIGKLIDVIRGQGLKVAVLACDPQSPLTGGALLGDRFRMGSRDDDGVFIRSLAALSGRNALAEHLPLLIRILEAFGFDVILLETVGAGQGDTAVRDLADVVALLLQPETGDDLQWEKAGVLEVADVVVVHKADLPGADDTAAQVRASLDVARQSEVPVIRVSSKSGAGLSELWQALEHREPKRREDSSEDRLLNQTLDLVRERFQKARDQRPAWWRELVGDQQADKNKRASDQEASIRLLQKLASENNSPA